MKSSLFESQRALSVLAFLCEIRVWGLFWEPGGTLHTVSSSGDQVSPRICTPWTTTHERTTLIERFSVF